MDRRCPKLAAQLAAGPLDAQTLRGLLNSQRMVKLFEEPRRQRGQTRGQPWMKIAIDITPILGNSPFACSRSCHTWGTQNGWCRVENPIKNPGLTLTIHELV